MSDGKPKEAIARRHLLLALGGCLGLEALPSACAPKAPPKPGPVRVPLADLQEGRRITVVVLGNPVEVTRRGENVVARSLLCTHTGCLVKWKEDRHEYVCACHGGRFDENGEVVEGVPPRPLPTLPVQISGGDALIAG
jgi:cytochrome b6-f complex iron-sulfur subunit